MRQASGGPGERTGGVAVLAVPADVGAEKATWIRTAVSGAAVKALKSGEEVLVTQRLSD